MKLYDAITFNRNGQRLETLISNVSFILARSYCRNAKLNFGEYAKPVLNIPGLQVLKAPDLTKPARSKKKSKNQLTLKF